MQFCFDLLLTIEWKSVFTANQEKKNAIEEQLLLELKCS